MKIVDTQLVLTKNRNLLSINWFCGSAGLLVIGLGSLYFMLGWATSWPLILALVLCWGLFLLLYWIVAALPVRTLTAQPEYDQSMMLIVKHGRDK
ncbi:hypothetical protein [Loigolactobacillus coryniformis]|uniref:Uncharacterized protein n=1 Tax=Loigolactobacillus coryniformis subsp. torquens DSM 20004 = KCTC 3535 TaxID=1423822 RepID=A0A2D1KM06_9LACO|nr:hypothetical protein [Loigolactobacillus coryniformis]ATO43072.1 hypothetical protein LC20004_03785 [Loigolactobacillus coryniformis subsp. torquens DSM 20004 = KCTC 3535]KRK76355.1 hypothetical protein FC16_GL000250 [Loigolactobacillus coryniformis subsp. torquens DSM 20004 = KCTC 3535]